MKTLIVVLGLVTSQCVLAAENKGKCSRTAARAAEKFASTIVYPKGKIEDRAVAYFVEMTTTESMGEVAAYTAYMDFEPSAGVSFKVLINENYGCIVRGIEQTSEE